MMWILVQTDVKQTQGQICFAFTPYCIVCLISVFLNLIVFYKTSFVSKSGTPEVAALCVFICFKITSLKKTACVFTCHTVLHLQLACVLFARVAQQAKHLKCYGHLHYRYITYSRLLQDEHRENCISFPYADLITFLNLFYSHPGAVFYPAA